LVTGNRFAFYRSISYSRHCSGFGLRPGVSALDGGQTDRSAGVEGGRERVALFGARAAKDVVADLAPVAGAGILACTGDRLAPVRVRGVVAPICATSVGAVIGPERPIWAPCDLLRVGGMGVRNPAEAGQGMVEYAFILVLISLVVIVMLITTGGQVVNMYSDITYTLHNQAGL